MMNFNMIDIIVRVFNSLFSYLGINHKFMCEVPESTLNSSEEVNTIIAISGDINGNIVFGFSKKTAREIAAKLMGVANPDEINEMDKAVVSALADFFSEFCKRISKEIRTEILYSQKEDKRGCTLLSSNPTYIAGADMYGIISKVPTKKLFFKVNGEKFGVAYSLE